MSSSIERRDFLVGTLGVASGAILGQTSASVTARRIPLPLLVSQPAADDRFCAVEFLGEVGGRYHYSGVVCDSGFPCTISHHTTLPYPRDCSSPSGECLAGKYVKVANRTRKNTVHPHHVPGGTKKVQLKEYVGKNFDILTDETKGIRKSMRERVVVAAEEVCYLSLAGQAGKRKAKLFLIVSNFINYKNGKLELVISPLGYEIDPAEEIDDQTPKDYEAENVDHYFCEVTKHPSGVSYPVFLRQKTM